MNRYLGIVIIIFLSSCGFQLRHITLPKYFPHAIVLTTSQPYGDFMQKLKQRLKSFNIHVKNQRNEAPMELNIISETLITDLKQISLDARVRDYTLTFIVIYQLLDAKGHILQAPQTITVNRNAVIQSSQILGSSNSQLLLEADLHRDAVEQIILRLSKLRLTH